MNLTPRVMEINKWDLVKVKKFCSAKETKNKEMTTYRMGKIFVNDVINLQGLISKI